MDAQVDYFDAELRNSCTRVHRILSGPHVEVEDASDEVVYNFEVPGSVLEAGSSPSERPTGRSHLRPAALTRPTR